MAGVNYKQRMINEIKEGFQKNQTSYFVTLNSLINDSIKQDAQVEKLIYWLNLYCYGNNFKKNLKRLQSIGASEVGTVNQGLHIHLIVMHNNDTDRTTQDIEKFIREKWYQLINAKPNSSAFGNLVDVRKVNDIDGCLSYMIKTRNYQPNEFNLQYF